MTVIEQVDEYAAKVNFRRMYPNEYSNLRCLQIMLAEPPEFRFNEEGFPGGIGENAETPEVIPGDNELDAPSLGDSLDLSIDSDDEYLFAGEEIDLKAH